MKVVMKLSRKHRNLVTSSITKFFRKYKYNMQRKYDKRTEYFFEKIIVRKLFFSSVLLHNHPIRLPPQNTRARGGGTRSEKILK